MKLEFLGGVDFGSWGVCGGGGERRLLVFDCGALGLNLVASAHSRICLDQVPRGCLGS